MDEKESRERNEVLTCGEPTTQIFDQIGLTLEKFKLQQEAPEFLDSMTYVDDNDLYAQIDKSLQPPSKQIEHNFSCNDNLCIDSIL